MNNKLALLEWGLEEKEAEVYLFLLKNGLSSIQNIAKDTGILRQTCYEIINRLEHKGLISQIIRENKKLFEASEPQKLKSVLLEKQEIIESVLPSLESIRKFSIDSEVKVFKGLKGIKNLYDDFLKSKTVIRTIQPNLIGEKIIKEFYIKNFLKKRIKNKIPIKIIREFTRTSFQKQIVTNKKELREVRLSKEIHHLQTQYVVYENKLIIIAWREEPLGVFIKDDIIANSFLIIFNQLWKKSKNIIT